MMNILAFSTLLAGSVGFAQDNPTLKPEKTYRHCFSPKFFYKNHNEIGYKYSEQGGGIEYNLMRPEGINVKISMTTNGKKNNALVESEQTIFYKNPMNETHCLYPILASRISSHQIDEIDGKGLHISKSAMYAGLGYARNFLDNLQVRGEVFAFKDTNNTIIFTQEEKFWGEAYSNPFGIKGKIGLLTEIKDRLYFDIEGHYAQTLQKCYKEFGMELSFKWGF